MISFIVITLSGLFAYAQGLAQGKQSESAAYQQHWGAEHLACAGH